jgi:hypothetical protein
VEVLAGELKRDFFAGFFVGVEGCFLKGEIEVSMRVATVLCGYVGRISAA